MDECIPLLLSPTQQVWPAKKKVHFNEERALFQYLVSQREKWKDRKKGRQCSSLFRALYMKGCDLGQQPCLFCIVKLYLFENWAKVKSWPTPKKTFIQSDLSELSLNYVQKPSFSLDFEFSSTAISLSLPSYFISIPFCPFFPLRLCVSWVQGSCQCFI